MTTKPLKRLCAFLGCLALLCSLGNALAEVELTADMGYDGVVTYLRRLPVRVQIANHGGDTTGTLVIDIDRDERNYDRYSMPLSVAAGATVNAVLPTNLSTKQKSYTVRWLVQGEAQAQVSLSPQKVLAPETLIVGVLSAQPQNLGWMTITSGTDSLKRGESWQTVALSGDTFPGDKSGMDFFDMLVVDGADVGLLDDAQKLALDAWLRDGGVVLLSGGAQAAVSFPYFSAYTGISAGALGEDENLSRSLLELFGLAGKELGQAVPVVALNGAKGRAIGAEPLADLTQVGDGLVLTASFSLSEKPLSAWMGDLALCQRMMLSYAQTRYADILNSRSDGRYQNYRYVDDVIINQITVPNQGGMALPLVVLAAFVALAGFGGYFLLKALDKREWMWVTVPSLCVLSALLIWAASDLLQLRQPMAVSYTVIQQDADGAQESFTGLGVACADEGRASLSLAQGTLNMDQQSDYYYGQEETGGTPVRALRYETVLGDQETLVFEQQATWEQNTFLTADVPLADCRVSGSAGWENGSLVFTVENQGVAPLSDGLILTDYGFVSVPALLPGQTVTAKLAPHAGSILDSGDIGDGMLLQDAERRMFSFYDFTGRYQALKKGTMDGDELTARYDLLQNFANTNDWYNGVGEPRYIAFSDGLADLRVTLNGREVTRTGQRGMLCASLAISPVSKDGTFRYLNGAIAVSPAELDGQGVPLRTTVSANRNRGYVSYRLSDAPVFAFDLSNLPEKSVLEHLDVSPRNAYYGYQAEAYSFRKGEWVSLKVFEYDQHTGKGKEEFALPVLADCLDEGKTFYVRFTAYGSVDEYADMSLPEMTMDGRLE